jgi:hypothetical protein
VSFWDRFKPRPKYGTIKITPYMVIGVGTEATPEMRAKWKQIAAQLYSYQNRMATARRPDTVPISFMPLELIEAHWNVERDSLTVYGRGDQRFSWTGPVREFLGSQCLIAEMLA